MQDYSIERSGVPNLDFTGEIIGQSGAPKPSILIYRTDTKKFVGQLRADQKFSLAQHFDNADGVIAWFKYNYSQTIVPAVQDAIEDAAKHDDAFKAAWNEHV
jgi:hypothetical protein